MDNIKHILLATDLSKANKKAVIHAKNLKELYSAKLSVAYALPVPSYYSFGVVSYDKIQEELLEKYQPHFEKFVKQNDFQSENCHIEVGEIAEVIFSCCRDNAVDLLVLGSHGEYGIRDQVGSTVLKLLQRSTCNIFIANSK